MKKFIQLFIALLFTFSCISQSLIPPTYAEIDTNYRSYVNQVFGQLEPNRIATGLLVDYAFDFAEPRIYNGTILDDSTCIEPGIFSELSNVKLIVLQTGSHEYIMVTKCFSLTFVVYTPAFD